MAIISAIYIFGIYFSVGDGYLAYFDDDFFYYLVTAKNTLKYGYVTFNGIVPTNGFHPLWFGIILILQGIFDDPSFVIVCISVLTFFGTIFTFLWTYRFLINYSQNTGKHIALAGAYLTALFYITMARGGMEVILTVPLIVYLLVGIANTNVSDTRFAIFSSLIVLSRLDSAILIGLIGLYLIYHKRISIIVFIIPFFVLAIYILSNIIFYDTIMPVSGMAKQLRNSYMPVIHSVKFIYYLSLDISNIFIQGQLFLYLLGIILLVKNWYRIKERGLFIIAIIFPLVLLLHNSIMSGWMFWSWYYYMFIPSTILTFVLIGTVIKKNYQIPISIFSILIFSAYILFKSYTFSPEQNQIYMLGKNIAKKLENSDDVIAMGDRAGIVSYLIENPVVQTEGLVMDKDFLMKIKAEQPVIDILKEYDVRYYISNNPIQTSNGWAVSEPYKHHKHIIVSRDTLRFEPFSRIENGVWKNYIFDLIKE